MQTDSPDIELAALFQAALDALRQERHALNLADSTNGNHGDHMVAIFEIAVRAAREKEGVELAAAMEYAAALLRQVEGNASARIYADGLGGLAGEFRQRGITLHELAAYVHKALKEGKEQEASEEARSGEVLKALVSGLAGWSQPGDETSKVEHPLDMGALFEFGMAYMQAKARGGSRAQVLADAAASVSPLGNTPHRYQSGVLVLSTLLQAMQAQVNSARDL